MTKLLQYDWLLQTYYGITATLAGVDKHAISIDNEKNTLFSYYEKGKRVPGQPSMIFIHGFSSSKESWLALIENIPYGYHCIIFDLPRHGETIEFKEDDLSIDTFVDKIKMFFDKMNLNEPMCLIGTSIGATIVAIFATKYPQYASMICLLAPPPIKEYESDLVRELRSGKSHILLPETSEEFYKTADLLTVKPIKLPEMFVKKYFQSRLHRLDEQKEILHSFLTYEYLNLEHYYEKLKYINFPVLIVWGHQDQLCVVKSIEYFSDLIPAVEVVVFDDCGHFISYDKPKETAKHIIQFLEQHSYCLINL